MQNKQQPKVQSSSCSTWTKPISSYQVYIMETTAGSETTHLSLSSLVTAHTATSSKESSSTSAPTCDNIVGFCAYIHHNNSILTLSGAGLPRSVYITERGGERQGQKEAERGWERQPKTTRTPRSLSCSWSLPGSRHASARASSSIPAW